MFLKLKDWGEPKLGGSYSYLVLVKVSYLLTWCYLSGPAVIEFSAPPHPPIKCLLEFTSKAILALEISLWDKIQFH